MKSYHAYDEIPTQGILEFRMNAQKILVICNDAVKELTLKCILCVKLIT